MNNEILGMLKLIQTDMKSMKEDINSIKDDVNSVKAEVKSIKADVNLMNKKIDKNTITLEEVKAQIQVVAEVQSAHKEQSAADYSSINDNLHKKTDLIETAVTSVSRDVRHIKDSVEVLTETTGKHEIDIKIIKRELFRHNG